VKLSAQAATSAKIHAFSKRVTAEQQRRTRELAHLPLPLLIPATMVSRYRRATTAIASLTAPTARMRSIAAARPNPTPASPAPTATATLELWLAAVSTLQRRSASASSTLATALGPTRFAAASSAGSPCHVALAIVSLSKRPHLRDRRYRRLQSQAVASCPGPTNSCASASCLPLHLQGRSRVEIPHQFHASRSRLR
jgi:hypothetical protein